MSRVSTKKLKLIRDKTDALLSSTDDLTKMVKELYGQDYLFVQTLPDVLKLEAQKKFHSVRLRTLLIAAAELIETEGNIVTMVDLIE